MICSKCNNDGVLNTVLGKDFYYCRTCKDEIVLQNKSTDFAEAVKREVDTGMAKMWGALGSVGAPTQAPVPSSHNWSSSTGYCSNCGAHFTSIAASSKCSSVVLSRSHAWYPGLDFRGDPANICQDCGADSKGLYPTYCPGAPQSIENSAPIHNCTGPTCPCRQLPKDPYP